jgi:hypothetical protein
MEWDYDELVGGNEKVDGLMYIDDISGDMLRYTRTILPLREEATNRKDVLSLTRDLRFRRVVDMSCLLNARGKFFERISVAARLRRSSWNSLALTIQGVCF